MKILLVHNHYRSGAPSGENVVFELERRMLERAGHEVATFERWSDDLGTGLRGIVRGAVATPWSRAAAAEFRRAAGRFRPDVVHAHNTFPFISPAVFSAAGPAARVLTLHNYRLFCAAGAPTRDGRICTECLERRSALPGLLHGCYRGSRLATLPVAAGVALHRRLGTWDRDVDAFIALTQFQRERMVAAGLPEGRVHVKPHFYPGEPGVRPWGEREGVVFVGRLGEEKGVAHLVAAWLAWGSAAPELLLVGDGPLRATLDAQIQDAGVANVRFLGHASAEAAEAAIAGSRLLVLPSVCFEGFPMVIREAFALGTPCAVSNLGPLPELVGPGPAGAVFPPGDPVGLLDVVRGLWSDPPRLEAMATAARREYRERYTEGANCTALVDIYEQALAERQSTRKNLVTPGPSD
jgi:glycosyltransferase involved in cell wall biosynthesis